MSGCDTICGVRTDRRKGFTNLKRNPMRKVTPSYLAQKASCQRKKIPGCRSLKRRKCVCHASTGNEIPNEAPSRAIVGCGAGFDEYESEKQCGRDKGLPKGWSYIWGFMVQGRGRTQKHFLTSSSLALDGL
jgi:hypothetical protein